MSHLVQRFFFKNVRTTPNDWDKYAIIFLRKFSDNVGNSADKQERPVYSVENPVSTHNVNPECLQDDDVKIDENTNCSTANPEICLEDPDKITNTPEYSPKHPASVDKPPTTCCMSGCSNCVYIIWAEALSKQMATADPEVAKKILDQVEDPSMKTFLQMELRNLGIIKKGTE